MLTIAHLAFLYGRRDLVGGERGTVTEKNTVISANFLVWKFCGKAQFLHSFERIARNYAETVPFHNISTPGN